MKMYSCNKSFRTTLFVDGSVERIEIKEGSDWFFVRKETQNRVVLCNNKIELVIGENVLKERFEQWG